MKPHKVNEQLKSNFPCAYIYVYCKIL